MLFEAATFWGSLPAATVTVSGLATGGIHSSLALPVMVTLATLHATNREHRGLLVNRT